MNHNKVATNVVINQKMLNRQTHTTSNILGLQRYHRVRNKLPNQRLQRYVSKEKLIILKVIASTSAIVFIIIITSRMSCIRRSP